MVESKIPITAITGSTAPLSAPKPNAFHLLPSPFAMGRLIAAPSGKFCTPMPIASARARIKPFSPPVTKALPKASPTDKPSGILCTVTARKSFVDFSNIYATINYEDNNGKMKSIEPYSLVNNYNGNYAYFSIPDDVKEDAKIEMIFTFRNEQYIYYIN